MCCSRPDGLLTFLFFHSTSTHQRHIVVKVGTPVQSGLWLTIETVWQPHCQDFTTLLWAWQAAHQHKGFWYAECRLLSWLHYLPYLSLYSFSPFSSLPLCTDSHIEYIVWHNLMNKATRAGFGESTFDNSIYQHTLQITVESTAVNVGTTCPLSHLFLARSLAPCRLHPALFLLLSSSLLVCAVNKNGNSTTR